METALFILAGILLLLGFFGSILPVLPGPPLSWLGLLALHFTEKMEFSNSFLIWSFVVMALIAALDYFIPIWGTKRFGGSRSGVIGSVVGLVVGLFFMPFGIIVGPFLGAMLGELSHQPNEMRKALRSATGSFVGFLVGTWLKLMYGAWAIGVMVWRLI